MQQSDSGGLSCTAEAVTFKYNLLERADMTSSVKRNILLGVDDSEVRRPGAARAQPKHD